MSEVGLIFGSIGTILLIVAFVNTCLSLLNRSGEDWSLSTGFVSVWLAGGIFLFLGIATWGLELALLIGILLVVTSQVSVVYHLVNQGGFSSFDFQLSGAPNLLTAFFGGAVGALVATFVGAEILGFIAIALLVGSITTVGAVWVLGSPPRFAAAGASFCLSSAILFYLSRGVLPDGFSQSGFVSLLALGLLSGFIVTIQETVAYAIQRTLRRVTNEEYASIIWRAISSFAGLLLIVWAVATWQEKLTRIGGASIGGSLGFALNILGVELPIPIWILSGGIDATVFLYVGCMVIGFHTLESAYTGWHATKTTAKGGVKAGSVAASKGGSAAQTAAAHASEVGESGSEKASRVADEIKDRYRSDSE